MFKADDENTQKQHASIVHEIVEHSSAVVLRVKSTASFWDVLYISGNISQYGYNSEDILNGRIHWMDVMHQEDIQSVYRQISNHETNATNQYSLFYRIRTAHGTIVCIHAFCTSCRDENGHVAYTDCLLTNHTANQASNAQDHIRQQEVLNSILLGLHDGDLDIAFKIILDSTGTYLDISRILLFKDTSDHTACSVIHEWCNTGIPSLLQDGPHTINYEQDIPEIKKDLDETGRSVVPYGKVPASSSEQFEKEQVTTCAIFAVYENNQQYGFICFDECKQKRDWPAGTLHFLELVSKLVSTAIMRKRNAAILADSRLAMETVLNNIPTYIFVTDASLTSIIFANLAYKKDFLADENSATLQGTSLYGGIVSFCSKCPLFSEKAQNCRPQSFEFAYDNNKKWVSVQCSALQWIDGTNVRLFNAQDVTGKKLHEQYIRKIAYTDHLTGLPNRYRFDIALQTALDQAQLSAQMGYVLFIDMDDFKIVNDGYGHDYGDALLISFASYLKTLYDNSNTIFRFGGDEFILLISPENAAYVQTYIDKLIERARMPWSALDKTFYCTISIGCVRFPDGGMRVTDIMKNADIAMYEAKRFGKNSYVYYTPNMGNLSMERAEIERLLRHAIANRFEGFTAHYQPLIHLETRKIYGAEALIRWCLPTGNMVYPGDFISLAEYLGLIVPLGEFVMREACKTLKQITLSGHPAFVMSINMSIRQLQQVDILQRVDTILQETGVNPGNLVFEVTESIAAYDVERIKIICNEFRKKGIQIAMDDFGTGYSSLGSLRDLPIDIIKIDREFIREITVDAYSHSFIRLISDLCHSMGRHVCVEGVETADQLSYCAASKVDSVQGYFYFKPLTKDDLLLELANSTGHCAKP